MESMRRIEAGIGIKWIYGVLGMEYLVFRMEYLVFRMAYLVFGRLYQPG